MSYAVLVLSKFGRTIFSKECGSYTDSEQLFHYLVGTTSKDEAIFVYAPSGKLIKKNT